jgi:hypothetical protein
LTAAAKPENLPRMSDVEIELLTLADAHELASLVAAYAQDRRLAEKPVAPGKWTNFTVQIERPAG